jgi:hypothetical protein
MPLEQATHDQPSPHPVVAPDRVLEAMQKTNRTPRDERSSAVRSRAIRTL